MTATLLLYLRPEVELEETSAAGVRLRLAERTVALPELSEGVLQALRRISQGGAPREELRETVLEMDGGDALHTLDGLLDQLTRARLLRHSVVTATGERLATAVPVATHFQPPVRSFEHDQPYVLSRFALLRRDGNELVLESPLAGAKILLHDARVLPWLHALANGGKTAPDLASPEGFSEDVARCFLELLFAFGTVSAMDGEGRAVEDANPSLAQWEFHDLLMHARSRLGRHSYPTGGTCRFAATLATLPAVKPETADATLALDQPNMETLRASGRPFSEVLESRRSIRTHGTPALTDRQLGEFLYRVARTEAVSPTDHGEVCWRPYPTGGGLHELELYPLVRECRGIAPGLYHYASAHHRLVLVSEPSSLTEKLLADAARATGGDWEPQILIVIAARFQRVAWKYESIAYTLTLKNVGVLFQTMYLVATAMGLAPCALGAGNADLFAHAAGTDYYSESSVGEFLLGSRVPDTSPSPGSPSSARSSSEDRHESPSHPGRAL